MSEQPEPNGWELLRGLQEVKTAIQDLAVGFVSQQLFALYQQTQAEQDKVRDSQIQKIESDIANTRRERARVWAGIGLAILTALGGLLIGLLTHTPVVP